MLFDIVLVYYNDEWLSDLDIHVLTYACIYKINMNKCDNTIGI